MMLCYFFTIWLVLRAKKIIIIIIINVIYRAQLRIQQLQHIDCYTHCVALQLVWSGNFSVVRLRYANGDLSCPWCHAGYACYQQFPSV